MYIYPHLGLGDHIICHGIVRNICTKYNNEIHELVTKPQFINSLRFMYRDIKNLKLLLVENDHEAHVILDPLPEEKKIYIGHHHLQKFTNDGLNFDEAFYKQIGLNFQRRWTDFNIQRDLDKEMTLLTKVKVPKEYIFIHEDTKRGFCIDKSKIKNKTLTIVTPQPDYTDNIFDYLTLIENAKEIHCFDSSFKLMIDSVLQNRNNLYYHISLMHGRYKGKTFNKLNWINI